MTHFIAIDGEADKQGRYIIMCDSEGRVLHNPNGIRTIEALQFLLSLPRKCEIVCYGLNYDVNQWIKDLPRATLEKLAETNTTVYNGAYRLEWIPAKTFTVTTPQRSVPICEVFGFFQTSFVKALEQWGIDPPAEIEQMKQKRGTFTQRDLNKIVHYCQQECRLLVELMRRLEDACQQAGCVPRRRWIGAGSIASSLMLSHRVKDHHAYDADLFGRELTDEYVLRAYFGGRTELYQQGWQPLAIAHDIRSAYPYAAMQMPSLKDAKVTRTRKYLPNHPFALWRVVWYRGIGQIAPFPVRLPSGQICYPTAGEGVYHALEVRAAIDAGFNVNVCDGVVIHPRSHVPFEWIEDVYEHRARFKREGSFAEKALKLGLNAMYGKTAQGYGFGRRPPFQSYYWAGFMTSYTRARVLAELIRSQPIMTATDGIVTYGDTSLADSVGIGSWEHTQYDRIATVQPGVYIAERSGERLVKSRGFFARDVDYDEMLARFYDDPFSCYHFSSRRFIGLKVALHRKDFSIWRQWVNERRSIAFEIQNKHSRLLDDGRVMLYPISGPFSSLPYVPKQSLYDDPTDDKLENMVRDDQPHREVD